MKIVNLEEFRKMPSGTLFSKFEPCVFESLEIKGLNTGLQDFYSQDISSAVVDLQSGCPEKLLDAHTSGESLPMDFDSVCRDGMYNGKQLFAVWESRDVVGLISRLQEALVDGYGRIKESPVGCRFTREQWRELGAKADSGEMVVEYMLRERASGLGIPVEHRFPVSNVALSEAIADKLESLSEAY